MPPGTLNILVLQLSLEKKLGAALRFAVAVALVEYPLVWIAVEFEEVITSSATIQRNFTIIGAITMTVIGIFSLLFSNKSPNYFAKFQNSGFRKGLILSVFNPPAIPWWIAMTAYLKMQGWISLETLLLRHVYFLGSALGALILLGLVAVLANRISYKFKESKLVKVAPGVILLILGLVALFNYLITVV